MALNFDYIFYYLSNNNFIIDKNEYLFQLESHPDFPSLLSISDTLKFFKIENRVFDLSTEYLDKLPRDYIVLLKKEKEVAHFFYLKKISDDNFLIKANKKEIITRKELEKRWSGLVLITDANFSDNSLKQKSFFNKYLYLNIILLSVILLAVFSFNHWSSGLFLLLASIGVILSMAAFKDVFNWKVSFIDELCSNTSTMDCTTIVQSNKWKIFNYISFRDLSLIFFISQISGLFIFEFHTIDLLFFKMQFIFLFSSLPIIILSIFYQKFIENKWCTICLSIIAVLILQWFLIYETLNSDIRLHEVLPNSILFFLLLFITFFSWQILKIFLIKIRKLKTAVIENNRVVRDFEIFSSILYKNIRYSYPNNAFRLSENSGLTRLDIVTNPFCGHCSKAHEILHSVYENYPKEVEINLIFNVSLINLDPERKKIVRSLVHIFYEKGKGNFIVALNHWFTHKNLNLWSEKYSVNFTESDSIKLDKILEKQALWCSTNELFMTPIFFLDGYKYPSKYDRNLLPIFIPDIIEANII